MKLVKGACCYVAIDLYLFLILDVRFLGFIWQLVTNFFKFELENSIYNQTRGKRRPQITATNLVENDFF